MKRILAAVMGIMMSAMMVGAPVMAADASCNDGCVHVGVLGDVVGADENGCVCDDGNGTLIKTIIRWIVNILTGAVVAAAVIGMAIAGIQYTTAGGNEQQMVKSKNRIIQIAIGLAIWIFMWAALNWLIPGFNGTEAGL